MPKSGRNKTNNVLVTYIIPRAKQLRKNKPSLSQKEAIRQASKEYREGKLGGGFLPSVKSIKRNLEGSREPLEAFLNNLRL